MDSAILTSNVTFSRPADTTAYSAKDVISDSVSTPKALEFTKIVPSNSAASIIVNGLVQALTTSIPAGLSTLRLHLFGSEPAAIADNSQFVRLTSQANYLGYLDFDNFQVEGTGSQYIACLKTDFFQVVQSAEADNKSSIFGIMETLGAFTPTSALQFQIALTATVA